MDNALHRAEPEAVVHELTALPPRLDYRAKEDPFAATNRLRQEGTRNLLAPAPPFRDSAAAIGDLERQVLGAEEIEGVILSYGWFYGPEARGR